jgi:electron transport complex protein RnfB
MKAINVTAERIDALLPQTQCRECGYHGCKPYAEALANGAAKINLCPPGGVTTLTALGGLLHIDAIPYLDELTRKYRTPSIAYIDEDLCIGCVKCINACPVDAIAGAPKLMHTVIVPECTGCELCVPACPMDCIAMHALPEETDIEKKQNANQWRQRYHSHQTRLARDRLEKQQQHDAAKLKQKNSQQAAKKATIAAAIARSKAKRKAIDE